MLLLLILSSRQGSFLRVQVHHRLLGETRLNVWDQRLRTERACMKWDGSKSIIKLNATVAHCRWEFSATGHCCCVFGTFSESVVMLMEGFLAVTAVLEPHLRLRPAAAPESCSASVLPVPGEDLLPSLRKEKLSQSSYIGILSTF